MTHPRRRLRTLSALVILGSALATLTLGAGCGAAGGAKEPMAPESMDAPAQDAGDALAELERAESELNRLLPGAGASSFASPPPPPAQPSPVQTAPGAPEAPRSQGYGQPAATATAPAPSPAMKSEAEMQASGDEGRDNGCAMACRALGSMRRAADHICDLAGSSDPRCGNAEARVSAAEERVNASCPACD